MEFDIGCYRQRITQSVRVGEYVDLNLSGAKGVRTTKRADLDTHGIQSDKEATQYSSRNTTMLRDNLLEGPGARPHQANQCRPIQQQKHMCQFNGKYNYCVRMFGVDMTEDTLYFFWSSFQKLIIASTWLVYLGVVPCVTKMGIKRTPKWEERKRRARKSTLGRRNTEGGRGKEREWEWERERERRGLCLCLCIVSLTCLSPLLACHSLQAWITTGSLHSKESTLHFYREVRRR